MSEAAARFVFNIGTSKEFWQTLVYEGYICILRAMAAVSQHQKTDVTIPTNEGFTANIRHHDFPNPARKKKKLPVYPN